MGAFRMVTFLNYLIMSIVAYLGLAGGFILAVLASEELKDGRRYFMALKDIMTVLLMLLLLYIQEPALGIIVLIGVAVYFRFLREVEDIRIIYPLAGAIMGVLSQFSGVVTLAASLIFIMGLASGTICAMENEKRTRKQQISYILLSNISFFVTALPLFFLQLKIVG